MRLAPVQRAAMDAAHRAANGTNGTAKQQVARKNVERSLAIGDTEYIVFRGRAYGVPPVPWRAGQRLQALCLDAEKYQTLTAATAPQYHALVASLPSLLWSLMRPVSRFRRLCYRLGLHRNPLRQATEVELLMLARFFLMSRTRSRIGLPSPPAGPTSTTP